MSWPVVKLGNAVESIMGQAPPGSECNKTGEGTIFVKAGEFGKEFPVIKEWTTKPLRYAKKGDTLLCVVGATCGKVNKAIDCAIGRSVAAIRPIKDKIDENYLFYFVSSWSSKLRNMSQGAAQTVINKDMIANLEIPLPPLDEQKRIAAILDKADAIRRKRQQAIQLADDFLRSVFLDMFGDPVTNPKGWELATLGSLIEFAKDGPHVSPKYSESGIPFLSTRHVKPTGVVWEDLKYVSQQEADLHWRKCKPQKGDVLYTKGGTTGIACPVDFEKEFAVWVHVALVRPKPKLANHIWLTHMLNTKFCYQQSQRYTRGATNKDLGLKRMVDIEMYAPPIEEQERFVKVRENVLGLLSKFDDSSSDSLFNSLSQSAFAGEL